MGLPELVIIYVQMVVQVGGCSVSIATPVIVGNSCSYYACAPVGCETCGYVPGTDTNKPPHYYSIGDTCYYSYWISCSNGSGGGWNDPSYSFDPNRRCSQSVCTVSGWDNTICDLFPNGSVCSLDNECQSGNCVLDYNWVGKICAESNECQHNGDYSNYPVGTQSEGFICRDCTGNTARWVYNSAGRFIVKTSGGNKLILDKAGNLLITGSLFQNSSPGSSGWQVKTLTGVKAQLNTAGNFYLKGGLSQQQSISNTSAKELLFYSKPSGSYVGLIDETTGNMQIRGQLGVGCSL